ncbi:MAG: hypothetical protein WBJ17_01895 [Natronincolaceae bacterium]|jgi:hypothetical protein|nr:recombinase [Bacillota bacterium]NLK90262.1 recombinase [Clostridiales bacterium]
MTYEEYEKKCDEIRMKNADYLDGFREDLFNAGLKEKTINRHCQNADFYINTYLLKEEPLEMICGTNFSKIDDFLGHFLIRKCMWSTPGTIKSTAASIKKFYNSMLQRGNIGESDYRVLIGTIKSNMDYWLKDCESYSDPEAPNPFIFS